MVIFLLRTQPKFYRGDHDQYNDNTVLPSMLPTIAEHIFFSCKEALCFMNCK